MLVTPAETSRSQTACADPAGVAMTPIATLCVATTASSSSTCRTVSLPILLAAQQAYFQTSLALVQAQAARLADSVALFQALGGGWWNKPPPVAEEQAVLQ